MTRRVFWCGVASRAHVLYGSSWLRQQPRPTAVTLFPPRRFLDGPGLTIDDVRALLPDDIPVTVWADGTALNPGEEPWCLSVGAVGLKPWLQLRRAVGARRMPVVVTDEGLGSYGNWTSRRTAWKREGVRDPWLSVRTSAVLGATAVLASRRWRLHLHRPSGWELNQPVADEFRRHVSRSQAQGAFFLSQPWPELGVVSEERYLAHIDAVATACEEVGLPFSVHPHPVEPEGRYSRWTVARVVDLAELEPSVVNAAVLLGTSSTAMLNLAAIHRVPAVRVGTPELMALDRELSTSQATLLQNYTGGFVGVRELASTLRELTAAPAGQDGS